MLRCSTLIELKSSISSHPVDSGVLHQPNSHDFTPPPSIRATFFEIGLQRPHAFGACVLFMRS